MRAASLVRSSLSCSVGIRSSPKDHASLSPKAEHPQVGYLSGVDCGLGLLLFFFLSPMPRCAPTVIVVAMVSLLQGVCQLCLINTKNWKTDEMCQIQCSEVCNSWWKNWRIKKQKQPYQKQKTSTTLAQQPQQCLDTTSPYFFVLFCLLKYFFLYIKAAEKNDSGVTLLWLILLTPYIYLFFRVNWFICSLSNRQEVGVVHEHVVCLTYCWKWKHYNLK